jgi:ParB-like chromosome segregation protein Spo0J
MTIPNTTTAPAAEPAKPKVPQLALHQYCELIPSCTEEEFKELKEDIKENGLRLPIKTFDNKILDGRSRYRACVELEAENHPVEFKKEVFYSSAKEVSAQDALAYVISMNVKRRHLSASQRALIAARLVTSKLGGDRSVKLPTEITQEQVAKLAGVSTKMVTDAVKVSSKPELAEKVLKGELSVASTAKRIREEEEAAAAGDQQDTNDHEDDEGFDADNAVDVYDEAEDRLVDALVALANASSVGHAKEKAKATKQRLDEAIEEAMKNKKGEEEDKAAA